MAVAILVSLLASPIVRADYSGTTGYENNITWVLDEETQTLTLGGTGKLPYYSWYQWDNYPELVKHVVIEDGITSVSNRAFNSLQKMVSISYPKTVTEIIDSYSYYRTGTLKTITVDPENPVYDSRDNCNAVIETATNTLLFGCSATKIPDTVEIIYSSFGFR